MRSRPGTLFPAPSALGAVALAFALGVLPGNPAFGGEEPVDQDRAEREKEEALRECRAALERMDRARTGRAIIAEVEFLAERFDDARPLLVETARRGSERQRRFAIKLLGENGTSEEDLEVVLGALSDRSDRVRLAAVMATRRLGPEPEARRAMQRYLTKERDTDNLKMAIKTFYHWRDKETVPDIVNLLERTEDEGVKEFCAATLRYITGREYGDDPEVWRAYVDAQDALRNELLDRRGARRAKEI